MAIFRLDDDHPTNQKIEKLMRCARDLGITLFFESDHKAFCITDKSRPEDVFWLADLEKAEGPFDFPPVMEHKVLTERSADTRAKHIQKES